LAGRSLYPTIYKQRYTYNIYANIVVKLLFFILNPIDLRDAAPTVLDIYCLWLTKFRALASQKYLH
jgi:hypothetical protein